MKFLSHCHYKTFAFSAWSPKLVTNEFFLLSKIMFCFVSVVLFYCMLLVLITFRSSDVFYFLVLKIFCVKSVRASNSKNGLSNISC